MGNARSYFAGRPSSMTARVFGLDDGGARDVEIPVTAAEVMLEAPGHVVARAEDILRTRRALGILLAEEELRAGERYILLPVGRKGSRLTDQQMGVVLEALSKKKNKKSKKKQAVPLAGRKVFPEAAGDGEGRIEGDDAEEELCEMEVTKFLPAKGPCGSRRKWRPTLETIRESRSH